MDFIKETLDWVNRERVACSIGEPLDDLPKGECGHAGRCPIAMALLADMVLPTAIWFEPGDLAHWPLPAHVTQFIRAFDAGDLPQYDVNAGA